MNKKGDVFQIFVVLIILTVVALAGLIIGIMTYNVNVFWDNHPEIMPVNSTAARANQILENTAPITLDYAVLFLFLGLNIGVIISAVRTNFSPTLIFFFICLTGLAVLISASMVNLYQGMAHTDAIVPLSSQLTFTNLIFSKYTPLIMCAISALVIIIMYGKSGGDILT